MIDVNWDVLQTVAWLKISSLKDFSFGTSSSSFKLLAMCCILYSDNGGKTLWTHLQNAEAGGGQNCYITVTCVCSLMRNWGVLWDFYQSFCLISESEYIFLSCHMQCLGLWCTGSNGWGVSGTLWWKYISDNVTLQSIPASRNPLTAKQLALTLSAWLH